MHAGDQYFASKFYEEFVAHASLHLEEENLVIFRWALAFCRSYTFEIHSQIKFRSAKTDLTVVTVQLQHPLLLTCRCFDVDLAPASLAEGKSMSIIDYENSKYILNEILLKCVSASTVIIKKSI